MTFQTKKDIFGQNIEMKKHLFSSIILVVINYVPAVSWGQNTGYNLSLMDNVDFQNFLTDIDFSTADLTEYYDGSIYLYKEPVDATLHFLNSSAQKVSARVNLNLQKSSFDVMVKEKMFSFSAKELAKVVIEGTSFLPKQNGVFYKLIFQNGNVKVIEEFELEIQAQSHIIGYESKKNDRIKVEKSTILVSNGNRTPFSRTKKGVSKLFDGQADEVKAFIKNKKLSPKSDSDLKLIFSHFYK